MLNSLTGEVEPLPRSPDGVLRWYSCGPTVYDDAHLGHARTYVCLDVMRRVWEDVFGQDVFLVMGVTDVDDKIIARARESGEDPLRLARRFEERFFEDMDALGVRRPDALTRVSEHVDDVQRYISGIEARNLAYSTGDGVFFDVAAFGDGYGTLAPEEVRRGGHEGHSAEAAALEKRNPRDFALWKAARPGEPAWDSPWGPGRPGWHIECSAMSHRVLGPAFELHTGGEDLKFPHHTNEIAQCEAHAGCAGHWVRCFAHTGHVRIAGRKMSKSLKNFVTVREALADAGPAGSDAFRLYCLHHRYRSSLHFAEARLADAAAERSDFLRALVALRAAEREARAFSSRWGPAEFAARDAVTDVRRRVRSALANDVDTPHALAALSAFARDAERYARDASERPVAELLASSRRELAHWLSALGLSVAAQERAQQSAAGAGAVPSDAVAADASPPPGESVPGLWARYSSLAEAALAFRAQARGAALRGDTDAVLRACDAFRDGPLSRASADLGVAARDSAVGEGKCEGEGEGEGGQAGGVAADGTVHVPLEERLRESGDYSAFDAEVGPIGTASPVCPPPSSSGSRKCPLAPASAPTRRACPPAARAGRSCPSRSGRSCASAWSGIGGAVAQGRSKKEGREVYLDVAYPQRFAWSHPDPAPPTGSTHAR